MTPPCAYCGRVYDFANRPVSYENCCTHCLPAESRFRWLGWPSRFRLFRWLP